MFRVISFRSTARVVVVIFEQDGEPTRYAVVALWLDSGIACEERDIEGQHRALELQRELLKLEAPPPVMDAAELRNRRRLAAAVAGIEAVGARP